MMELFQGDDEGPNVHLENCYSLVISPDLSLEMCRSVSGQRSGRNLSWEFCLLEAPELQRADVSSSETLLKLHCDQQRGPSACIIQQACTALRVQVLCRLGSDGLLNSENPHFVFGLLLPVPFDRGPHGLPGPLGISWGSLKALDGGCHSVHLAPEQGHQATQ